MYEDVDDRYNQDLEEPLEETIEETPEELAEKRKKRRYILYGAMGFILVLVIVIATLASSNSEEDSLEATKAVAEKSTTSIPHPIVEMAKIKNVPLQGYNVSTPLIANTPQELIQDISVEGWLPQSPDYSLPGLAKTFSCVDQIICSENKEVKVWLRIFSNNRDGRDLMLEKLEAYKDDNLSIVSEAAEVGSGGFIVNNNKTISYWFYYEPNIVAKTEMYHSKQGTLQETRDWAHRLNYSIYKVVGR